MGSATSRWHPGGTGRSRLGVTADAVRIGADLGRYRVLIAPSLPCLRRRRACWAYIAGGGTLILGPRSYVKEVEGAIVDELLPGLLRKLAGCHIEEYDAFSNVPGLAMPCGMPADDATAATASRMCWHWKMEPRPRSGTTITTTPGNLRLRHEVGAGRCYYVGTVLDDTGLDSFLRGVLGESNVPVISELPASVEVTCRVRDGQCYRFYLNHADEPVEMAALAPGTDLLTGAAVTQQVTLLPFGVLIVKETP